MSDKRVLTIDALQEMAEVRLQLDTVTLGEAAAVERASGLTLSELISSRTSRRLLAIYIHGLRNYDVMPSWSELSSLRVLDVSSSTSRSRGDGASQTSND